MATYDETRNANNAAALGKITVNDALIARFNAYLKAWHKNAGDKPTREMLTVGAAFSKNQSVCEAGFVAMQLRPAGCSVKQLGIAFDCGPAHNHTRDLVNAGYVKRSAITAPSLERAKYFTLELTKKGEAHLAKVLTAAGDAAAPVKVLPAKVKAAKAKVKAAKATVKAAKAELTAAVITPVDNATPVAVAPVNEPVAPADLQALAERFNG